MLRTNFATRPFYNERAVHLALGVAGGLTLALTLFNVNEIVSLSRRHTELSAEADGEEAAARAVTQQTLAIRRQVSSDELKLVAAATREANAIIDRRTFSWTDFFNRIENTLPADVMLASVRPDVGDEGLVISMVVIGRRVEDIDSFMDRLEQTGAFTDLLARQEEVTEGDMYRATLRGRYIGRPDQRGEEEPRSLE